MEVLQLMIGHTMEVVQLVKGYHGSVSACGKPHIGSGSSGD